MRKALLLILLFPLAALAGCVGGEPLADDTDPEPVMGGLESPHQVFAADATGVERTLEGVFQNATHLVGSLHAVGEPGPEPSVGITSSGNVYFQALAKTMRSVDGGATWVDVSSFDQANPDPAKALAARTTSDPYLWVDPDTDRVFQVNMVALVCSHIAWSDDEGETWLGNPMDCGPVPVNDHIKLGTGPWTDAASTLGMNPVYPNAVYYAYNKLVGGYMAVSLDGGATFPILSEMFASGCNGALHGAITSAPDGAVYVPARYCPGPLVAYSYDNGLTWDQVVVGEDVGVPEQQKNPEIAVDTENNVYLTWVGADNRLWMSVSSDRAQTWSDAVPVSPPAVGSVTWPAMLAGDPGRVAFAYIGTEDSTKGPWEVEPSTEWHIYYTYSTDALSENATFVTMQMTPEEDPIQRGTICIASSSCQDGNRNLLDFIDMHMSLGGRPYIAYADGCTSPECLADTGTPADSRDRAGYVAIIQEAPSLYADIGWLESLMDDHGHDH